MYYRFFCGNLGDSDDLYDSDDYDTEYEEEKRDTNKNIKKTVSVLPKKQVRHTGGKVSRLTT